MGNQKPYCRGRTDNTKDKTKIKTEGETTFYKTLHRKPKTFIYFDKRGFSYYAIYLSYT